jgi:hypothetical protein
MLVGHKPAISVHRSPSVEVSLCSSQLVAYVLAAAVANVDARGPSSLAILLLVARRVRLYSS